MFSYFNGLALFEDMMEALYNMFRDDRPQAVKDHAAIEYVIRATESYEDVDTDAAYDWEELEYADWDLMIELEPAYTDGEDAYDTVFCAASDAEEFSDAARAWWAISNK